MKVSQYLEKMLAFYDSPKKWTKGTFFANSKDDTVGRYSRDIQSCCLSGCLQLVSRSEKVQEQVRNILYLSSPELVNNVINWNDDPQRKFTDVKNVIRRAIKYAQTKEKVSKKKG